MANTQQSGGIFGPPKEGQDPEVVRLKAELQVEQDRHRILVERARAVEKKQSDRDSAAALDLLENLDGASTPAA